MITAEPTWTDDIKPLFAAPFWLPPAERAKVGQEWQGCMRGYFIALEDYADWSDEERICVNVRTLYAEFAGEQAAFDVIALFTDMARYAHERGLYGLGA